MTVKSAHAALGADFDGDNDVDIVATDYVNGEVLWYQNEGGGRFSTKLLDANLAGAYPASVGDVDKDGDVDVMAGGYLADTFAWYQNNGSGSFTRAEY